MRSSDKNLTEQGRAIGISRRVLLGGALVGTLSTSFAQAQSSFPSQTIRIIVPFGAGGVTDLGARIVAEKLSEKIGQPVVVENMPGAGGIAAVRAVLTSKPDGHTLGLATNGTAVSVSLFKQLPFDPVKDFSMVSKMGLMEMAFVVREDSPYKSLQDFIKAAKGNPGKLNVGTVTVGGTQNLAAELFKTEANIDFQIVAYKNSPEIFVALLRDDVQLLIEFYAAVQGPLKDKQARALATSAMTRSANLPDVPTVHESGLPGYDVTSWNGFFAPQGTPQDVIMALNKSIHEALADEDLRKRFREMGLEPSPTSPERLMVRLKEDIQKWGKVVEAAGIPKR